MDFSAEIDNVTEKGRSITFDIKGNTDYGLHKSLINAARRTLLTSIRTVGFRTDIDNSDIKVLTNSTSLHNELLMQRISLIPLYIDPEGYQRQYLFRLKVQNNGPSPVMKITAKDFDIYLLKEENMGLVVEGKEWGLDDYETTPVSDDIKKDIFRPFEFKGKDEYILLTELKKSNTNSDQGIDLYGVPSVSYAYENSRWMSVSRATYMFKKNDILFDQILQEKLQVNDIKEEDKESFKKELFIKESERYFHRDKDSEPYWYSFTIDSTHFHDSKVLFMRSNQIIIEQLEILRNEFPKISTEEDTFMRISKTKENLYNINVNGYDDTMGNVLQSYISTKKITDTSILQVCGYKRPHPLEEEIVIYLSLNMNNEIYNASETQKVFSLIQFLRNACDELIHIFQTIKETAESSL